MEDMARQFMKNFLVLISIATFSLYYNQTPTRPSELFFPQIEQELRTPGISLDRQLVLSETWIRKAKEVEDFEELFQAYAWRGKISSHPSQIKYGDSLVSVALRLGSAEKLGEAFLSKGSAYVNIERYQDALTFYLKAHQSFQQSNNELLEATAENQIAQVKVYIGEFEEAHRIFYKNTTFFKQNARIIDHTDYRLYYLYSLLSLIDTNTRLSRYTDNVPLLKEGNAYIRKEKIPGFLGYFLSAEGTDAYYRKDYALAASKLTEALQAYDDQWKHLSENFYLGMSYWNLQRKKEALPYLFLIDNEYNESGRLDPLFRPALETLLLYYRGEGDQQKTMEYLDKLIALNKIYEKDYKSIYRNLNKDFDLRNLEAEKSALEKSIKSHRMRLAVFAAFTVAGFLILAFLAWKYYSRHRYYKKLFEQFSLRNLADNTETSTVIVEEEIVAGHGKEFGKSTDTDINTWMPKTMNSEMLSEKNIGLNPATVDSIMQRLNAFETEKRFTQKGITLAEVAAFCGTNTAYLSRIINQEKHRNFSQYLNDLRLEEVILNWKRKPQSRNLSMQETASRAGFSTAQSFSKNFQERYGITPTYFLKRLKEDLPVNNSS